MARNFTFDTVFGLADYDSTDRLVEDSVDPASFSSLIEPKITDMLEDPNFVRRIWGRDAVESDLDFNEELGPEYRTATRNVQNNAHRTTTELIEQYNMRSEIINEAQDKKRAGTITNMERIENSNRAYQMAIREEIIRREEGLPFEQHFAGINYTIYPPNLHPNSHLHRI